MKTGRRTETEGSVEEHKADLWNARLVFINLSNAVENNMNSRPQWN